MPQDLNAFKSEIPLGHYRHYKGPIYQVFGCVTHSESEERLVLYAPLVPRPGNDPALFVRPLTMFNDTVETPMGLKPRFEWIDEG